MEFTTIWLEDRYEQEMKLWLTVSQKQFIFVTDSRNNGIVWIKIKLYTGYST